MNKKDLSIIAHLRQDARISLTNLSKKTGIPISTLFDRLKIYKNDFITKHTTLIDFTKLGYNTRANITIKVDREDREIIKEYLCKHQNINSVYKINNGFDFLIEGYFEHVKDLDDFMEILDTKYKILDKNVFYIINEIKTEEFMSRPNFISIL